MDPEQTAPIGAVCSGSTLFAMERHLKHFSRQEKQMTFVAMENCIDPEGFCHLIRLHSFPHSLFSQCELIRQTWGRSVVHIKL